MSWIENVPTPKDLETRFADELEILGKVLTERIKAKPPGSDIIPFGTKQSSQSQKIKVTTAHVQALKTALESRGWLLEVNLKDDHWRITALPEKKL